MMAGNDHTRQVSYVYDKLQSAFTRCEVELSQELQTHISWLDRFKQPQPLALTKEVKEEQSNRPVVSDRNDALLTDITNTRCEPLTVINKKTHDTTRSGSGEKVRDGQSLSAQQTDSHSISTEEASLIAAAEVHSITPARPVARDDESEKKHTPTPQHTKERAEKWANRMTPRKLDSSPQTSVRRTPGTATRGKRSRAITQQHGRGVVHPNRTRSTDTGPGGSDAGARKKSDGSMRIKDVECIKSQRTQTKNAESSQRDKAQDEVNRGAVVAMQVNRPSNESKTVEKSRSKHTATVHQAESLADGELVKDADDVEQCMSNMGLIEHSSMDTSALDTSALDTSGIVVPCTSALDVSGLVVFAEAPHMATTTAKKSAPPLSNEGLTSTGDKPTERIAPILKHAPLVGSDDMLESTQSMNPPAVSGVVASSITSAKLRSLSDNDARETIEKNTAQMPTKPVYLDPTIESSSRDGPSPLLPPTTTKIVAEPQRSPRVVAGISSVNSQSDRDIGSSVDRRSDRSIGFGDERQAHSGATTQPADSKFRESVPGTSFARTQIEDNNQPTLPPIHHPCGSDVIVQLGAVLPVSPQKDSETREISARIKVDEGNQYTSAKGKEQQGQEYDINTPQISEQDRHHPTTERLSEQQNTKVPTTVQPNDAQRIDRNNSNEEEIKAAKARESDTIPRTAQTRPVGEDIWGKKPRTKNPDSSAKQDVPEKEKVSVTLKNTLQIESADSIVRLVEARRIERDTPPIESGGNHPSQVEGEGVSIIANAQHRSTMDGAPSDQGQLIAANEQNMLDVSEAGSMADVTVRLRNPLHTTGRVPVNAGLPRAASPAAADGIAQHEYSFIRTVGTRPGLGMAQISVHSDSSSHTATINATFLGTPLVQTAVASTPQASLIGPALEGHSTGARRRETSAMSEESPLTIVAGSVTMSARTRTSVGRGVGGYARRSSHSYRHPRTSGVPDASFIGRAGSGSNFNTSANSFATPSGVPRPRLSVGRDGKLVYFKEPGAPVGAYKAPAAARRDSQRDRLIEQQTTVVHDADAALDSRRHLARLFRPSGEGVQTADETAREEEQRGSPRVQEIEEDRITRPHNTVNATDTKKAAACDELSTAKTDHHSQLPIDVDEARERRRLSAADTCFGWRETAVKVRPITQLNTELKQETLTYDTEEKPSPKTQGNERAFREEATLIQHRSDRTYTHQMDESGLSPQALGRGNVIDNNMAIATTDGHDTAKQINSEEPSRHADVLPPPAEDGEAGRDVEAKRLVNEQTSLAHPIADSVNTPKDVTQQTDVGASDRPLESVSGVLKSEQVVSHRSISSGAIDMSESNFVTPSQTPYKTPVAQLGAQPNTAETTSQPQPSVRGKKCPLSPAKSKSTKTIREKGAMHADDTVPNALAAEEYNSKVHKNVKEEENPKVHKEEENSKVQKDVKVVQDKGSRPDRPLHKKTAAFGASALPKKKVGAYDERKKRQEENIARIKAEKIRKQQEKELKEKQRMAEHQAHVENERQRKIKDREEREKHRKARLKGLKEEPNDRKRKIPIPSTLSAAEAAGVKKTKLAAHTNKPTQAPSIEPKSSATLANNPRSLLKVPAPVRLDNMSATSTLSNNSHTTNTVTTKAKPAAESEEKEVAALALPGESLKLPQTQLSVHSDDTGVKLIADENSAKAVDDQLSKNMAEATVADSNAAKVDSKAGTEKFPASSRVAVSPPGPSEPELQSMQTNTHTQRSAEAQSIPDESVHSPARVTQQAVAGEIRENGEAGWVEVTQTTTTVTSCTKAVHIERSPAALVAQKAANGSGTEALKESTQHNAENADVVIERVEVVSEHTEETQQTTVYRGSVPVTPVVEPLRGALDFSTIKPAAKGNQSNTAHIQATPMQSVNSSAAGDSALLRGDTTQSSQTLAIDDEFAEQSERLDAEQKEIEAARARVANGKKLSAARFSAVRRATNERPIIKQREPLHNRPMGLETNAIVSAAAKVKESKEAESRRQREKEEQRVRKLQIDNELARLHRERRELAAKAASIATPQPESVRYREAANQQFATPTRTSPVRTLRADEGPLESVHQAQSAKHDGRPSYTLPNLSKTNTGQLYRTGLHKTVSSVPSRTAGPSQPSTSSQHPSQTSKQAMFSTPAAPSTKRPVIPATQHVFKTPTPVIKRNTSKRKKVVHKDNYNIDDLRSDGTTDDDESPKKKIPDWAQGSSLRAALVDQYLTNSNPATIFDQVATPKLDQIFSSPGTVKKAKWNNRTSSAMWKYDSPSGGLTKK